jgi:hypothetical protein
MLGRFCAAIAGLRLALDRQRVVTATRVESKINAIFGNSRAAGWACSAAAPGAWLCQTVTVMVARLWTAAAVVVTLSQHWLDAAALDNGLARTPALGKHSA